MAHLKCSHLKVDNSMIFIGMSNFMIIDDKAQWPVNSLQGSVTIAKIRVFFAVGY